MRRRGFTLIEIVVVVVVVGIITAAGAAKMVDVGAKARESSTRRSLAVLREAIDCCQAENGGTLPGQSDDLPGDLAPYLVGPFPQSHVGANNDLVHYKNGSLNAKNNPSEGWMYSRSTGALIVNSRDATIAVPSVTYDEW